MNLSQPRPQSEFQDIQTYIERPYIKQNNLKGLFFSSHAIKSELHSKNESASYKWPLLTCKRKESLSKRNFLAVNDIRLLYITLYSLKPFCKLGLSLNRNDCLPHWDNLFLFFPHLKNNLFTLHHDFCPHSQSFPLTVPPPSSIPFSERMEAFLGYLPPWHINSLQGQASPIEARQDS